MSWKFSYTAKRSTHIFAGNMADAGMSTEEEHHPEKPWNQEVKLRDGELWVDLNESQDNKSELKGTMNELRYELRKVKEDNEQILKAQEEINIILLAKIHNEEKIKLRNLMRNFLKLPFRINVRVGS